MSDNPVLAALARLETVVGQLAAGQTALQAGQTAVQTDLTALQTGQAAQQAGLTALQTGQAALQAGLTALQTSHTALQAGQTALQSGQAALQADQTRLRVDLMDRMDRLQDSQTEMKRDMDALLEMLVTNQGMAERSVADARMAMDIGGRSSSLLTKLLQRVRTLEDDVRILKERGQAA